MALYGGSAKIIIGNGIVATGLLDLKGSIVSGTSLFEMCIQHSITSNALTFAMGRATTELFQTLSQLLSPYDPADRPTTTAFGTAWSVEPVVPTQFFRRYQPVAAIIGAGCIWSFPRGLRIPASGSLLLWTLATGASVATGSFVSVEVDE